MGYYTIRLSPASQDMTTIVTEFGKFKYNHFNIAMCASGYIFQANIDELLDDIEGVKTYINDILVLDQDTFEKHRDQLIILSRRLHAAGLNVNAPQCSLGLKEVPYLGYVMIGEGIKPDSKKVQGIMDLSRPSTTTKAMGSHSNVLVL